ncbi:class IIb bacteriocin, lactobin A/cerein 7B family protein [Streptococcus pantholopis]|uniref:Class IIb bacteriocin, lactobin A/cerein 7B family protein n=2 Tax=Streptococcus TaxID=1301 RepID=A0A172QAJ2_9STRE|nr:class IIb bacteriocin, lactobin A/cerein 7B family protein [Streptococcus pantholopis]
MDSISKNYMALSDKELMNTEGGIVVTGTAVGIGVGIFTGSFAVGYAIGQSTKR